MLTDANMRVSLAGAPFVFIGTALLCLFSIHVYAGVLPEDRGELVYHRYEGGGVTVEGPSLLVRKKLGESIDLNGTYDVDMVSSASVDVMSSASPYKERRKQWSVGGEYLRGKTTYSTSFLNSTEPDYISNNVSFGISEDMFGDLTTVTLGFSRGWDEVKKHDVNKISGTDNYTTIFFENGHRVSNRMDRRNYQLGMSQILTKKIILMLAYESSAQDGFMRNPYRKARYCVDSTCLTTQNEDEIYPHTRSSNAFSIGARYFLPYRASLKATYRYYFDTWGIRAHTGEIEYVHPIGSRWTIDSGIRYYTQSSADFYADVFPFSSSQNFLARDKELATFNDFSFHVGIDRKITLSTKLMAIASFSFDRIQYSYSDFRNNAPPYRDIAPNQQPLYSYGANVYSAQFSVQY